MAKICRPKILRPGCFSIHLFNGVLLFCQFPDIKIWRTLKWQITKANVKIWIKEYKPGPVVCSKSTFHDKGIHATSFSLTNITHCFSLFQNIPRHFLTFLNCLFVCIFEILNYWTVTAKSNGSNIKMAKRKGPWYKERKNQIIIGLCTCILIALVVLVVLAAIFITKDKEEGTKI